MTVCLLTFAVGALLTVAAHALGLTPYAGELNIIEGTLFNDIRGHKPGEALRSIELHWEPRVNKITFYTNQRIISHGKAAGKVTRIFFSGFERVAEMEVCLGQRYSFRDYFRVYYVRIKTTKGQSIQGGEKTSKCSTFQIPKDQYVFGMHGQVDSTEFLTLGLAFDDAFTG